MKKKSKTSSISNPKFSEADEIFDDVFGLGKILSYTRWDNNRELHFYCVRYYLFDKNGIPDATSGCPEDEMRLLTKLEKVLK